MPKIFELLGFPAADTSDVVTQSRKQLLCPFTSGTCDGGGNRYMSEIDLSRHPELQSFFHLHNKVPSGVCSIQVHEDGPPWIICPRRLLYIGADANNSILTGQQQSILWQKTRYPKGTRIGIWSEVKVKYTDQMGCEFDYTFDYVLMPISTVTREHAKNSTGLDWRALQKQLVRGAYKVSVEDSETYIHNFPDGRPVIVEVMTSSTSGGNKTKRTCIPQAFEDCILSRNHTAPGINYRQVWARMASQLIVKSQAALAWGGHTIWVLQDVLANYISSSTALNLSNFVSNEINEVNVLSFSYADLYTNRESGKPVPFWEDILYSGPIKDSSSNSVQPCFQDIVLASTCPPKDILISSLCKKRMVNTYAI